MLLQCTCSLIGRHIIVKINTIITLYCMSSKAMCLVGSVLLIIYTSFEKYIHDAWEYVALSNILHIFHHSTKKESYNRFTYLPEQLRSLSAHSQYFCLQHVAIESPCKCMLQRKNRKRFHSYIALEHRKQQYCVTTLRFLTWQLSLLLKKLNKRLISAQCMYHRYSTGHIKGTTWHRDLFHMPLIPSESQIIPWSSYHVCNIALTAP